MRLNGPRRNQRSQSRERREKCRQKGRCPTDTTRKARSGETVEAVWVPSMDLGLKQKNDLTGTEKMEQDHAAAAGDCGGPAVSPWDIVNGMRSVGQICVPTIIFSNGAFLDSFRQGLQFGSCGLQALSFAVVNL
ncbi:hypothetical protein NDU88_005550 [Pleurodeles waltl]|uniref:Uncharacterized protein n=1 Tax=Pleurodeles waltl TaxID=8319 RepID=A0AAV7WXZ5_PLEWA|nr:hypothetical protein NDU88_005550 [Pleurodeles waltl]